MYAYIRKDNKRKDKNYALQISTLYICKVTDSTDNDSTDSYR